MENGYGDVVGPEIDYNEISPLKKTGKTNIYKKFLEVDELHLDQWRKPNVDFETMAVSATVDPGTFSRNSLVMPIVTSSVFICHGSPTEPMNTGFHYGRCGNPTRDHFESCMAQLDGAAHALAFSSGVAGIAAVVQTLKQGDHIVYIQCSNGDSDWLFRNKWKDFGIEVDFIYSNDSNAILDAVRPNTKMVWLETPINPTLNVVDIEKISGAVHSVANHVLVVVDNTFLTPVLQRPLDLGADVVVYSCTKYLCGHADVIMGVVTTSKSDLYKKLQENQICLGAIPSPWDCYLMIRSLKTLPIRMRQHFVNGQKIANFLELHPCVEFVSHPGLNSHPQHALAIKQQFGHSGMVTFLIRGDIREAATFINSLKTFKKAPSLGTDVSIASIPSKASHSWLPEEERQKLKITDNMIRLSVGLENSDHLIQDLDQALRQAVPIWI
ncbi:putative cystathionine gamma-lyase 2 [Folsomia candida]|uniref:putative cystathionine gamma-lyase 2 n=1 Tax=Folsomia candida TaxID=158441 RepID=UPI000B8F67BF|nr:putative cystathionine gamma-lyase 2 [Folsomia candida]